MSGAASTPTPFSPADAIIALAGLALMFARTTVWIVVVAVATAGAYFAIG